MSKHTPGPWKATHCTVSAPETEDRLGFTFNVRNGNRDDTKANARLIAAAPDMLEALKDAYPHIENDALRSRIGALIIAATGAA